MTVRDIRALLLIGPGDGQGGQGENAWIKAIGPQGRCVSNEFWQMLVVRCQFLELGTLEIGITEICTAEIGAAEIGAAEMGTLQVGTLKVSALEVGTSEIGILEVGKGRSSDPEADDRNCSAHRRASVRVLSDFPLPKSAATMTIFTGALVATSSSMRVSSARSSPRVLCRPAR